MKYRELFRTGKFKKQNWVSGFQSPWNVKEVTGKKPRMSSWIDKEVLELDSGQKHEM